MDPRLAKKKEKSRVRAEQHRVATAQDCFESWRDYESKYPEELDYYEIARAKGAGKLQAWDDDEEEKEFKHRGRERAPRHRGKKPSKAKADKAEKSKEKELKIEDLSRAGKPNMDGYKPSSPQCH